MSDKNSLARITALTFDEQETPTEITVALSIDTAAFLAQLVGRITPTTSASSALYDCLVGGFFNRFYDDGVDDYLTDHPDSTIAAQRIPIGDSDSE